MSFNDFGRPVTVALQLVSAVAGAALGNELKRDNEQARIRAQAKPAIRRLFEQAQRMRSAVELLDQRQDEVVAAGNLDQPIDHARVADWLGQASQSHRVEIDSILSAIEDWGDLAQDVRDEEVAKVLTRSDTFPSASGGVHR